MGVSTLEHVTLQVELSPDVFLTRLRSVASARRITVEQLAADTLARVAGVDVELADVVRGTISEHSETLDRLART